MTRPQAHQSSTGNRAVSPVRRAFLAAALLALSWTAEAAPAKGAAKPSEAGSAAGARETLSAQEAAREKQFLSQVDKVLRGELAGIDTLDLLAELENRIARKSGQESFLEAAGVLNYRMARFEEAKRALSRLKKPSANADRALALSLYELKEYRKSLVYFNRLRDPRANRADWERFCHALAEAGPRADALKEWEAFRSRNPGTDAGLEFLAEAYRRPLDKDKLMPVLEALIKKTRGTPSEGRLMLELGRLYGETHVKAVDLRLAYLKLNPEDAEAKKGLALMYEARGEAKKALPVYLEAAPRFGDDLAFNRRLAAFLAKHDKEKAVAFYDRCRTLAPKDAAVALEAARLLDALGRHEQALEAWQAVLALNPAQAEAKGRLAALAAAKPDAKALAAMAENERKNPKDHAFQFQIAALSLKAGKREDAYKYVQKALQNGPQSGTAHEEYAALLPRTIATDAQIVKHFPLLQKLAQKGGASPELNLLLGRGYALYKNQPRAAEAWGKVFAENPQLLEGMRQPIVDLHAAKEHAAAGALAERYVKVDGKDLEIRRIHAASLSQAGAKPERLRAAIQGLVEIEQYNETWYLRLAELDLAAGDEAAALKHAREWCRIHPDDAKGLRFLEPLALKAKDAELYLQTLGSLARVEPQEAHRHELKAARYLVETGKASQALEVMGGLTAAFQNDADFWHRYGMVQAKLGREGAGAALEKAYRLNPGNLDYARAFAASLTTDAAIKANLQVFRTVSREGMTLKERARLARALYLSGDYAAAAREWDAVLPSDTDAADSTAGLAYLKSGQAHKAKPLLERRLAKAPGDVSLLATLSELYGREGDGKRRMEAMERLVREDQGHGDYLLRLAREKEKAGAAEEALRYYSQWAFRHQDDAAALTAYRNLAEKRKDTSALIEALRYMTRLPSADRGHRFQLAELYYARSGETKEIEALVKQNPDWGKGKLLLVQEWHGKGAWDQLATLEGYLKEESRNRADLLEPLADLHARRKQTAEAHQAYYGWLATRLMVSGPAHSRAVTPGQDAGGKADRAADLADYRKAFDKVLRYARDEKSPYLTAILRQGTESFPQDVDLKADYAAALGVTRSGLDAWTAVLLRRPDDVDAVTQAASIAKAVGDRPALLKWARKWSELSASTEKPWRLLVEALDPPQNAQERNALADAQEGLLRLVPGNADLMQRNARLQESLGRWDKAVGLYRNLLYLTPKDRAVREKLISLMKEKARKEDLAEVLAEIQSLDSSAHEAQFELARLALQKNDREKAYAYLTAALEQSPLNHVYQQLLPKAIHNREQTLKHFKLMQEMAGRPGLSRSDAANADLFLLLARGHAWQPKPDWEQSAANYALVRKLAPQRLRGEREPILAVWQGKDFALAAVLTEDYLMERPEFDKEIQQIQIMAYEKVRKDPALVRKALKALLTFDKENAGGLIRLAELDLKAGDTVSAIANIRACLMTSPNEARAYRMLLPLVAGREKERITYVVVLEKLARLDSTARDVHLLKLADFYFQRKNYKQTARLLSEVADLRPRDAQVHYRLGQARNHLGVGDLGVSCFRRAHEAEPSNVLYAHTYAQALQTPQEYKDNLRLFLFVEEKGPSPHERRGLALAHFYNGNLQASANAWDKALAHERSAAGFEERFLPEAALAYMGTRQPAKALPLYETRLPREGGNLGLLDTVFLIHDRKGDEKGRTGALEALVSVDAAYKDYQLLLARAKEKARDTAAAIDHYGQWTARNQADAEALKAFHRLADGKRDTASLENALRLLVRLKGSDAQYHFQLAELQFKFTGETAELERLAKAHPTWHRGRVILAKEFYRRYDMPKMIPYERALAEEAERDKALLEPLAELYAYQEKKAPAQKAFRDHLAWREGQAQGKASGKARTALRQAFDKAWIHADATASPHLAEILDIGNRAFPGEPPVQHALAAALGKDPKALDLYRLILSKDGNDLTALRAGSEAALALGRTRDAVPMLEKWAALEPSAAKPWQHLVEGYAALKEPAKHADALERLLQYSPADAALAFRAGQAHGKVGNREKALELLLRADELRPKDPAYSAAVMDLLKAMTEEFLAKGQAGRAVELYGLVLERDPKHRKANLYMGMWLAENKDFPGAEPMLKLGIDQSPEPAATLARAWRLLGESQAGMGRNKQAFEAFTRALALDAQDKSAALARLDMTRMLGLEAELADALADAVRLDSSNVDACASLGEIRLKEGNYPAAAALYKRVVVAQAGEPSAWSRYGEALEGASAKDPGLKAQALSAWQKAWDLGDRNPYMLQGFARLHREKGTLEKAEGALEELTAVQPENDEAHAWLAEVALRKGDLGRAEEMFAQAAQSAPDRIEYTEGLGEVFYRRGDAESAKEILEAQKARLTPAGRVTLADVHRTLGKPDAALPLYEEAGRKAPSARVTAGHAEALLDRGKPLEAKRLIETSGHDQAPLARLALGKALLALREREKSLKVLTALVKEDQDNGLYLQAWSMAQMEAKNHDLALKGFKKALDKRPDLTLAAYYAGHVLLAQGRMQEARAFFYDLAQRLPKPDRALGLRGLGDAALAEKKPAEAVEYLVQAAEVHPTPEVLARLSRVSLSMQRTKEAEEWAQKSLEADEDYPEGIEALADVMVALDRKDEARDFLKEAVARNPRSCGLQMALAKVLVSMENFTGLAGSSRQALSLCPEEPLSYYFAGVAADRAYQKKEAQEYFKEYKKLGGDKAVLPKGY